MLCWRSVDALLMLCWCSVDALLMLWWCSVDALLMICWCSVDAQLTLIIRWSNIDINHIAYIGGQYCAYGYKQYYSPRVTQDATPEIFDALLTLIFRLGLWPCHFPFCLQTLPINWLWFNDIAQPLNYTRCNTQDCWRSVDALLLLCWCFADALLMRCWRCVDTHCQVKRHRE